MSDNQSMEQDRQSAGREKLMRRILSKGNLRRAVEGLVNWWDKRDIHSIESITRSLNYYAMMHPSEFIPRGLYRSEVLPFSQSEVRRIIEACGKSDIFRPAD